MSFTYAEPHVCEGYDRTKLWFLALIAGGALAGGPIGLWLGVLYGQHIVSQVCKSPQPNASYLCSLINGFAVPSYVIFGAALGAAIGAAAAVVAISAVIGRRPKA